MHSSHHAPATIDMTTQQAKAGQPCTLNNEETLPILKHFDGAEPNPLDTSGLRLLSLDGGGMRRLSSLYILKASWRD